MDILAADTPVYLLMVYTVLLIMMVLIGFGVLGLMIKMQRFPIPITFPILLSLYLQRVPIDLLGKAIRILQHHQQAVDLYRMVRVYQSHWEKINCAEDLVNLIAPGLLDKQAPGSE
ncbi:hypothetical protein [Poriferisphaera sp. WC338]|uniref:hypothetical protein n=1 Tax=Poriferisphaera sp. WC338 TaxID=3425129 RepID=UPI003D8148EA